MTVQKPRHAKNSRAGTRRPTKRSAPTRSSASSPDALNARYAQQQKRSRLFRKALVLLVGGFAAGAAIPWAIAYGRQHVSPEMLASFPVVGKLLPQAEEPSTQGLLLPRDGGIEGTEANTDPLSFSPPVSKDPYEIYPWAKQSYVPSLMYHDVVGDYKQVWFDTTADELRRDFEAIQDAGATPISIDQFYAHLREGAELPEKPILLTFDDGYMGQYEFAYPLLKEFNYPATFFVQTGFVGVYTSKDHFTWDQMREMEREGLVSIEPHTINHPPDLRELDDAKLERELIESKRIMEAELGRTVNYLAYPTGYRDERVLEVTERAGYKMAFTMDKGFAGQSPSLLEVQRFNQYKLGEALVGAKAYPPGEGAVYAVDATAPVAVETLTIDDVEISTISGGRFATVHADRRYNVGTLVKRYQATAGINGSFFSIPWINSASNIMVGPVLSSSTKIFVPGRPKDNDSVRGRPMVLVGKDRISFVPFHPETMNDLFDIQTMMPDVTDLFVAGAWLIKDGQALSEAEIESFNLSSAAEYRPRVFFGLDIYGKPVYGVTQTHVNSAILAEVLAKMNVQEAILLDSGFSSSLVYGEEILATGHATAEQPSRPVPHAIMIYDVNDIQNQPRLSAMQQLVSSVPEEEQLIVERELNAVLRGDRVFRLGDGGAAIYSLQLALESIARDKGEPSPLISGPDGAFGNEVARALIPYVNPEAEAYQPFGPSSPYDTQLPDYS
ncbi:MAG: polysaccharide deacetylase family protein, partial [Cyanobacteria bacterium J06648_11]